MPKRDPNRTARIITIQKMKLELRSILTQTLMEVSMNSESSLNAFIGSKADDFIELKTEVIRTPEEYVSKWIQGLDQGVKNGFTGRFKTMHDLLKNPRKRNFRQYCELFLRRSFLRHYEELAKVRPIDEESIYWFGINDAHFGLFITPRFNKLLDNWENDKSEIRAFRHTYWTIGHILATGICYPNENRKYIFSQIEDYLSFFYSQVRLTKSFYQLGIAERYIEFVRNSANPENIPLLIPEIRYDGEGRKHTYRLDFLIINPYTMDKIGIEISPWSTHGKLSGKHKTLIELNDEARANFEKEIKKIKSYFNKFNIYTLVYTDTELANLDILFKEVEKFLMPNEPPVQLSLNLIQEYFDR
ncbi:MAG: hypothetical protein M0P58_12115 [Bacteroidales bacterium]|nr:hypothetical protein [Bacteroidales bacterium]